MAVPNALGVLSRLMLENVNRGVTNFHVGGDRILDFFDTVPADQKLGKPADDGSLPFTAEHVLQFNEGGTVSQIQINETTINSAGAAGWNTGVNADSLAPDPTQAPQPTIRRIAIGLKETVGVLAINRDQVLAEDFGLMIAPFAARLVAGVIKKLNNWRAANAFTDGSGWLAQCADIVALSAGADATITIKNGTNRRFEIGERYEIAAHANWPVNNPGGIGDTSAAKRNDADLICVGVDPTTNNKIVLRGVAGMTGFNTAVDNHIVKKGTVKYGNPHVSNSPDGFDFLLNNTGTIYGLDRTQFHVLKSQIDSSGSLTALKTPRPDMITNPLDVIVDAGYETPAFILSSRSVRSKYAYTQGGQGAFVLPNYVRVADGGIGAIQTTYEDRVFNWMLSAFIEPHTIMGIEPRAFVKYAPRGDRVIDWWVKSGGLSGVDNIFRPVYSGSRLSKTFAAEWSSHFQLGVIQPFLNFITRFVKGQKD